MLHCSMSVIDLRGRKHRAAERRASFVECFRVASDRLIAIAKLVFGNLRPKGLY